MQFGYTILYVRDVEKTVAFYESAFGLKRKFVHDSGNGEFLPRLKYESYRDHGVAYDEKEDTPRPLLFQLDLLRQVGFAQVEVLHKNVCFAAFGAVKG